MRSIFLGVILLCLGVVFIALHVVITVNRYFAGPPNYIAAYLCVLLGIISVYLGFSALLKGLKKK